MDYTVIIGLITFISAGAITYFTIRKDRAEKQDAQLKDEKYRKNLQSARDTIVELQNKTDKQSAEYYEQSSKRLDSLNEQQMKLIEKQREVITLQQNNQRKAAELNNLQNQMINEMTGGNSYCYLDIRIVPNYLDQKTKFMEIISLTNSGDYPLQNIQITLEKPQLKWNKSRSDGYPSSKLDPDLNYSFYIPYLSENKNLNQKAGIVLLERPIPDAQLTDSKITYVATIALRKGIYTQIYKFAQFKNVWLPASKLFSNYISNFSPVIDIHPYFPNKKPDGTIDWTMIETVTTK
ncbi:MAG: hypothetical protein JNK14_14830 [Chitinophagaceae bacterium]|nr:hypothetical protein [Chitinophagaceae bacterium]